MFDVPLVVPALRWLALMGNGDCVSSFLNERFRRGCRNWSKRHHEFLFSALFIQIDQSPAALSMGKQRWPLGMRQQVEGHTAEYPFPQS